ncbi:hypothetical protein [Spirillospora sp. NPDC047279]|uniref:hypothetical protein n=1 Tax=Spirillospora sp. NPDC047279 TaxID=3155478 RepID=UPI0033F3B9FE
MVNLRKLKVEWDDTGFASHSLLIDGEYWGYVVRVEDHSDKTFGYVLDMGEGAHVWVVVQPTCEEAKAALLSNVRARIMSA